MMTTQQHTRISDHLALGAIRLKRPVGPKTDLARKAAIRTTAALMYQVRRGAA